MEDNLFAQLHFWNSLQGKTQQRNDHIPGAPLANLLSPERTPLNARIYVGDRLQYCHCLLQVPENYEASLSHCLSRFMDCLYSARWKLRYVWNHFQFSLKQWVTFYFRISKNPTMRKWVRYDMFSLKCMIRWIRK